MPTAPINDEGAYVYYEDSGAPDGVQDYTTIVLVHGYSFNGATFRRLLPQASTFGLRIFTMNMRDYHGSSTYSQEEITAMASTDTQLHDVAVRQFSRDVAGFLTYVCTTQGVPRLSVDGTNKTGGVVLVTWSLSNLALLGILGDPATLESKNAAVLSQYLRKMVLYDPPNVVLGVYPEIGLYFPLRSPEVPVEQKPYAFAQYIGSYYTPLPDGAPIAAETMREHTVLPARAPTICSLTADELARTFEPGVIDRSGLILRCSGLLEVAQRNTRRALLGANAVLPDVEAVALWCDQSAWICVWAAKVLQDLLTEEPVAGARRRDARVVKVENANHFIHWDEPERFVRILKDII